jgi:hypothetical protein
VRRDRCQGEGDAWWRGDGLARHPHQTRWAVSRPPAGVVRRAEETTKWAASVVAEHDWPWRAGAKTGSLHIDIQMTSGVAEDKPGNLPRRVAGGTHGCSISVERPPQRIMHVVSDSSAEHKTRRPHVPRRSIQPRCSQGSRTLPPIPDKTGAPTSLLAGLPDCTKSNSRPVDFFPTWEGGEIERVNMRGCACVIKLALTNAAASTSNSPQCTDQVRRLQSVMLSMFYILHGGYRTLKVQWITPRTQSAAAHRMYAGY